MLRVCASLGTCIRVTHHRCNRPQKLESLSRQVQCERTPSASTFRSVPNTRHNQPSRSVRKRRLRHVIQNAGGPAGGITKSKGGKGKEVDTPGKKLLVGVAVGYLALVLVVPTLNVFAQAFSKGIGPFIANVTEPDFLQAVKMTLLLSAVAVPINTVFGVTSAILIARNEFPGKLVVMSMLDLPFSISPVVTGLMLVLLYGREGWFAPLIRATGFNIVFAFPGMALATLFVTMPFVVRELIPILETMDLAEEEAARTMGASDWQVFWNVTLPNIRYGLLYGIILTNAAISSMPYVVPQWLCMKKAVWMQRAMGEFGAVSVISGNIIGKTQTLTLFVEGAYKEYNTEAAFSAAVLLSFLAVVTLFVKGKVEESAE